MSDVAACLVAAQLYSIFISTVEVTWNKYSPLYDNKQLSKAEPMLDDPCELLFVGEF